MGASGGTLQTKRSVVIHFSYLDDGFIIEIDGPSASQSMACVYTLHINERFVHCTVWQNFILCLHLYYVYNIKRNILGAYISRKK
jgi:hypothetical protein